jgi:peptide/nickel transport system substrate-binding protein
MRRHTRLRPRRRAVGVVAVAAIVATTALAATTGVTGAAVAGQTPKNIDRSAVVRIAVPISDQGGIAFDPTVMRGNPANALWLDQIYDVMIHDTADGKGSPGLATKWAATDPSTAELTLRSGVKFSDGTPFNAAAVKAAWERVAASGNPLAPAEVRALTGVDAVDEDTVRVHFSQPVAQSFLDAVVHHSWYMGVPSPAAVAAGTVNTKPIGAGPYLLKDFTPDQKVTLTKNPGYWNPKAQLVGGFDFSHAAAGVPSVNALTSGSVDMISFAPADAVDTIKSTPGLQVSAVPGTRVLNIEVCATNGVFANKDARQAIQYALDRNAISEGAYNGTAQPWQTVYGPTSPYYNKQLNKTYTHNVKKAKQLLAKAGVAPGTTITGLANSASPQPTIAEIVQSQLKDVGLNLQYNVTTNLVDDALRVKPDMLFVALDPQFLGIAFGDQPTVLNVCLWQNPQVKADLLATQDPTKSAAERQKAADDFQKIILDESPVMITVLSPVTTAHTNKVKGVETIAVPYGPNLNTVYMTK